MTPHSNWLANSLLGKAGRITWALIPAILACLSGSLAAQNNPPAPAASAGAFKQDFLWSSATTNRLRLAGFLDYSYVAAGDVKYYGTKGHSEAETFHLAVTGEIPLTDRWYVPLGIGSENIWMNSVVGAPVPDQINTLRFNAGLGLRLNEQWTFAASLGPVLYALQDIESNDLGIVAMVNAAYRVRPNLLLSFGAAVNPDTDVVVFPAIGARWDIRTNLTLNLMFPKPGIIYRAAPRLSLFAGGGLNGATFRTDNQMASRTGLPQFNRALATYWDFHLGVGVEYQLIRRVFANLEGGYSLGRQIHYTRVHETVKFDPSPYVQAGLRFRF